MYVGRMRDFSRSKEDSSPVGEEADIVQQTPSEGEKKTSTLKPPRFKGERDLSVRAKLAGVELTLSDRNGNLLTADVKGYQLDNIDTCTHMFIPRT